MKTYGEYIKEYLHYVPSDIAYIYKNNNPDKKDDFFHDDNFEEQRCESNRKYDIMSLELSWILDDRYEARKDLPRSKYRKLAKAIRRRIKNLKRKYK
jgi:hypothetical protein